MISGKLYLYTSQAETKNGYPVKIRIIAKRKSYYLHLKQFAFKANWHFEKQEPKKTHPDFNYLVKFVARKKYDLINAIEQANKYNYSVTKVMRILTGTFDDNDISFTNFYKKHIETLIQRGRTGNASYLSVAFSVLENYISRPLSFGEIDYSFLKNYRDYLDVKGLSNTSIRNYLAAIRVVWNEADREFEFNYRYPFKLGLIPSRGKVKKLAISIDVIKCIEGLKYPVNERRWHARNYFLFSFYMAGMSLIDIVLLKNRYIIANRLMFDSRQKVKNKSNPAEINLLIPPQAKAIIALYKNPSAYVFTALKAEKNTPNAERLYANFIRNLQTGLNIIAEDVSNKLAVPVKLSMGTTRHTFRTRGIRLGYNDFLLKEMMGHRITDVGYIYQDKYPDAIKDAAQLAIINT